MKYTPIDDRILVQVIKSNESEKSDGGIILDTVAKPIQTANVVAAGPGKYAGDSGKFIPCLLRPGDVVIIASNTGFPMSLDLGGGRQDYLLFKEADILMVETPSQQG